MSPIATVSCSRGVTVDPRVCVCVGVYVCSLARAECLQVSITLAIRAKALCRSQLNSVFTESGGYCLQQWALATAWLVHGFPQDPVDQQLT